MGLTGVAKVGLDLPRSGFSAAAGPTVPRAWHQRHAQPWEARRRTPRRTLYV